MVSRLYGSPFAQVGPRLTAIGQAILHHSRFDGGGA
jgi:hypothetical protein